MNQEIVNNPKRKPEIASGIRKAVIAFVIDKSTFVDEIRVANRGAFADAYKFFNERGPTISQQSIARIWKKAINNRADADNGAYSASPNKKGRTGRPLKWNRDEVKAEIQRLPRHLRQSFRCMSANTGIPTTTLFNMLHKDNVIRRHSAAVKPILTEANKMVRYYYATTKLERNRRDNNQLVYASNYNEVHLDEKWFFLTKQSRTYYLTEDEDDPIIRTRHKSHIMKVMFLCAVARPRFDREGNCNNHGFL